MAFPTIPTGGRILSNVQANATATRTFPNLSGLTKNSGDLLIAIVVAYQTTATANAAWSGWTAGWTEFVDQSSATTMAIGAAYRWSDGTETGTIAVTQAATITGEAAMFLLSISGAHLVTIPTATAIANGTTAVADPAALDPANWAAEDTLWISVACAGETAAGGTFTGVATPPTNYTNNVETGISQDVVGGVEGAVAFRQLNASSENVGTWSGTDVSNARNSALVIAVRPLPTVDVTAVTGVATAGGGTLSLAFDFDIAGGTATATATGEDVSFVLEVSGGTATAGGGDATVDVDSGGGGYDAVVDALGARSHYKLDEPSGTTMVDRKGVNNGVYSGGVTLAQAGRLADGNDAADFDGVDGKGLVSSFSNVGTDFTAEGWFKTTDTAGTIFSVYATGTGAHMRLHVSSTRFGGQVTSDTETSTFLDGDFDVNDGAWHHAAIVKEGSAVRIYMDGTLKDSDTMPAGGLTVNAFSVAVNESSEFLDGLLDEVAVYDEALTEADIDDLIAAADDEGGGGPVNLDASGGTATASGGTISLTVVLAAASGVATAAGGTDALAFTWVASAGTATAAGGTVNFSQDTGLTATNGTASASGTTPILSWTYSVTAGTATAGGGDVSTGAAVELDFTGKLGQRTAHLGLFKLGSLGEETEFAGVSAVGGTAFTGGTVVLTAVYTSTGGTATAGGGTVNFIKIKQYSAVAGIATTGGVVSVRFIYTTTVGTATAGGGTVNFSKSKELSAVTGTATTGGVVSVRFIYTTAAGQASAVGGQTFAFAGLPPRTCPPLGGTVVEYTRGGVFNGGLSGGPVNESITGGTLSVLRSGVVTMPIRGGVVQEKVRSGAPVESSRDGTFDETSTGGEVL